MNNPMDQPSGDQTLLAKLGRWMVLMCFAALAIVPLAMYGCAGEVDRWQAAAALNLYEDGETETAIQRLQEIAERPSADLGLKLRVAQLMAVNERGAEGLVICEQLLKETESSTVERAIRGVRAACFQETGDFEQGLEEFKTTLESDSDRGINSWNNLAYYRALAGQELGLARTEIQKAINRQELKPLRTKRVDELFSFSSPPEIRTSVSLRTRALLASAMASRELDCREIVMPLLDQFVQQYEQSLFSTDRTISAGVYEQVKRDFPISISKAQTLAVSERTDRWLLNRELCMLRASRSVLSHDLGDAERRDMDRARIEELGLETDLLLRSLPQGRDCLAIFRDATQTLDTRGYVLFRSATKASHLVQAKFDMDVAVLAAEMNRKSFDSPMRNSTEEEMVDVRTGRQQADRTFAVLVYHRMLVNEGLGNRAQAIRDIKQIRELGFEPNSQLF